MMTEDLIKKIETMKWEKWLERPFHAFVFSLFEDSTTKESFEKIGVSEVELRTQFGQKGSWYLNNELLEEMDSQVENYLKTKTIFNITEGLALFRENNLTKIEKLIDSPAPVDEKFEEIFEILKLCCTYIWLAHGIESFYNRRLKEEVPKYIKNDVDKFIGDASFPKKQNAHAKFEDMMRNSDIASEEISQKFGWLKARDGFSEPFSEAEIEAMRKELDTKQTHAMIDIPEELTTLFEQVQELVYFRTERTDVFYELFFKSRPILKELAKKYDIEFSDMRYYRAKSLLSGKLEKYQPFPTFAYLDGEVLFQNEPIVNDELVSGDEEIKGSVAFRGNQRGIVKVIKDASELNKIQSGDILVTQMTFPSFISAMHRAAAFVTDEGGVTCHAAIIARELKKPCIVGTKIATQALKDGDTVEVDADNGLVKILGKK